MNDVVRTDSPREIALYFKESGLFPDLQSEAQAYVKIVAGQELGLGPLASVSGLNVIKGRVTFSANLLASMVKRHPAYDYRVVKHDERGCRIVFTQDGTEIGESTFTIDDAKRAGLSGSNWTRYPKAMLFARALTQGVRWFCPDVTAGHPAYSPEEMDAAVDVDGAERVTVPASQRRPVVEDPMAELAAQVDDYDFSAEQRAALREFVRTGGDDAIDTAISLLADGNPAALFAGIAYESEAVDGEVVG